MEVYKIGEGCVTISIHAIGGSITGKDVKTHGKRVFFQESSTFCHRDSEPYDYVCESPATKAAALENLPLSLLLRSEAWPSKMRLLM